MEYKQKAKMLLGMLEASSILSENELTYEKSHIGFLEKTLDKLKSSVECLRYLRYNTIKSGRSCIGSEDRSQLGTNRDRKSLYFGRNFKSGNITINSRRKMSREARIDTSSGRIDPKFLKTEKITSSRRKESSKNNYYSANLRHNDLKSIKSMDRIFTKNYNLMDYDKEKSVKDIFLGDKEDKVRSKKKAFGGFRSSRIAFEKQQSSRLLTSRNKGLKKNRRTKTGFFDTGVRTVGDSGNLRQTGMRYLERGKKDKQRHKRRRFNSGDRTFVSRNRHGVSAANLLRK